MSEHQIKFYQTGTFTVGNRLLQPDQRSGQANIERYNSLNSGHRACQGCGEALGARYAVDAAMRATEGRLIAANATGCLEVFSTPYPETSWQLPWFHSLFGNTAAVGSGMAAVARVKAKKSGKPLVRVIAQAVTAVRLISVSDACPACSKETTTCFTSATTTKAI